MVEPQSRRKPLVLGLTVLALFFAAAAGGSVGAQSGARITVPPAYPVAAWTSQTDNLVQAIGTVQLAGKPVSGVFVKVGQFQVPTPTDSQGRFAYLIDQTLVARHVAVVTDDSKGKVGGTPLTSAQQKALDGTTASFNVVYAISQLKATLNAAGQPVITGRVTDSSSKPPPLVGLLTYQLTGTVVDADGKPVANAQVSTRTLDRDYWTVSTLTDSAGHYTSLFTASDEESSNPVPFTVRVTVGDVVYQYLSQEFVYFKRLQSGTLDLQFPPRGYAMALPRPTSYPGAVYTGIVVGPELNGTNIKPVSITWPDRSGTFQIVLPHALAGRTISFWEGSVTLFSRTEAAPGKPLDLVGWPSAIPADAPLGLAPLKLPG